MVDLLLPGKAENVTIKIVESPYMIEGDDICCNVYIWSDPDTRNFVMILEEKLWKPLCDAISSDYMLSDRIENDPDLTFLKGTVISIWGCPNLTLDCQYFGHFGCRKHIEDLPNIFEVKIRHDLEDAEKIGGKLLENSIEKEIDNNRLSWKCIERNLSLVESSKLLEKVKILKANRIGE